MKSQLKVSVSLFLVTILVFSILGCSKGTNTNTSTTAPTTEPGVAETSPPEVMSKEPVTITILSSSVQGAKIPGVQEDNVAKEIAKRTGITMSIEDVSGDNAPKILAMNASGDLNCLTAMGGNAEILKTLIDSDSILDATELMKTHGSSYEKNEKLKFAVNFSKEYRSQGTGKLYVIPLGPGVQSSPAAPTAGAYIRWDYYKELGYPKVENIMDLLPVLKQIQDKHPKASNGKSAYGVSFWSDWDLWPIGVFGFIDGYAEGGAGAGEFGVVDISNDEFIPVLTDESTIFWKYLTFYNKAHQMGILDPDSGIQKFDNYVEKIAAGQSYFMIPGWMSRDFQGAPDQGFALIDTTGTSDKSYSKYGNDVGFGHYVISKNCPNPDRAMDLLNFLASAEGSELVHNGIQGQTWDLVDGKPMMKPEVMKLIADPNNSEGEKLGVGKYANMAGMAGAEIDPNYNIPYKFEFDADYIDSNQSIVEKDSAKLYGVKYTSEIFNNKKYSSYGNVISAAIPVIEDKDYDEKLANVKKYTRDNWIKLILAKDDAEFNALKAKFISDLNARGYKEIMDQYIKVWNETKDKINSLK